MVNKAAPKPVKESTSSELKRLECLKKLLLRRGELVEERRKLIETRIETLRVTEALSEHGKVMVKCPCCVGKGYLELEKYQTS